MIVVLNLGPEPIAVTTSAIKFGSEILLSTFLDREGERLDGVLDLRGDEGVIITPPLPSSRPMRSAEWATHTAELRLDR